MPNRLLIMVLAILSIMVIFTMVMAGMDGYVTLDVQHQRSEAKARGVLIAKQAEKLCDAWDFAGCEAGYERAHPNASATLSPVFIEELGDQRDAALALSIVMSTEVPSASTLNKVKPLYSRLKTATGPLARTAADALQIATLRSTLGSIDARVRAAQLAATGSKNVFVTWQRALIEHDDARSAEAAALFEQVLSERKDLPVAQLLLGITYMRLGRIDEARPLLLAALSTSEGAPDLRRIARSHIEGGPPPPP